jgi:Fe-S-cluster containining protein
MASDVHFACTGCGKCCDTPPSFTIPEAMALYRDFILTVRLAGGVADPTLPADHPTVRPYLLQRAHMQAHGAETVALRVSPTKQFEATLQIRASAVPASSDDPCPALTSEGLCSIYERRPQRCRTVPFDYDLPEPFAVTNGTSRLHAALQRDWKCDVSEAAPVVAQDGRLSAGPYRDAYDTALQLMETQEPALAVIIGEFQRELAAKPALVGDVVKALSQGQSVDFSFFMVLDTLHGLKREQPKPGSTLPHGGPGDALLANLPELADFLQAQLALIADKIAHNLARKRPMDRLHTERLRAMQVEYQRALMTLQAPVSRPN